MTNEMKEYRVRWEIDIDAKDPKEAARKALEGQITPFSWAVVFDVTAPDGTTTRIDLAENTTAKAPVYFLLVTWDDIEPEIKGPYSSAEERFQVASEIRREKVRIMVFMS